MFEMGLGGPSSLYFAPVPMLDWLLRATAP
jgi:hypothetical protein